MVPDSIQNDSKVRSIHLQNRFSCTQRGLKSVPANFGQKTGYSLDWQTTIHTNIRTPTGNLESAINLIPRAWLWTVGGSRSTSGTLSVIHIIIFQWVNFLKKFYCPCLTNDATSSWGRELDDRRKRDMISGALGPKFALFSWLREKLNALKYEEINREILGGFTPIHYRYIPFHIGKHRRFRKYQI